MATYGMNTWGTQPEFVGGQLPLPLPLGSPASAVSPQAASPPGAIGFSIPQPNRPLPAPIELPAPMYLPQMLGGQTLPQALNMPQFRQLTIPSLAGGYGFAVNPERLNQIVGMTQQELDREQRFNQARFQNSAEGIRTGALLDKQQMDMALAPLQARSQQIQNAQGEFNYATGLSEPQKLDAQYRMQSALQAQQARDAYNLALAKAKQDKSLEIQKFGFQHAFNNAEATVKRWLSSMRPEDMAELQRNAMAGGDVGMLLANPNFQARTGATDVALIGALDLFRQAGVHPYYLIGGNQLPGQAALPGVDTPMTPQTGTPSAPRTVGTTTGGTESSKFQDWLKSQGAK